jgi:hypothetical protein
MELLVAILIALGVYVDPTKTTSIDQYPKYDRAKVILETNAYKIDPATGIIIIEDGSGDTY